MGFNSGLKGLIFYTENVEVGLSNAMNYRAVFLSLSLSLFFVVISLVLFACMNHRRFQ
jgi:hypothetical protein